MLKAIIFDLDGVITDSAHYHYLAWKELADALSIPFDSAYNEKLKGVSRLESLELILANGGQQEQYSPQEKQALATQKNEHYKTLIEQITQRDVLPGILSFLQELRENHIQTGIASVSRNATVILDRLTLSDAFDVVVDAANVARAKPFPDIFLTAATTLNVLPQDCIGIEDAKAGIAAINAAGMKSVGVGSPDQMADADLILSDTSKLSLPMLRDCFEM